MEKMLRICLWGVEGKGEKERSGEVKILYMVCV